MSLGKAKTGLAPVDQARLYYEVAGEGQTLVMIHAGVADSRQWNNEFAHFARSYRVVRYDLRGYGKSEPVAGEFSHLGDLEALVEHLRLDFPLILMGCSMGGGLALDYTLAHPAQVRALIMVGSGPGGLELEVPESDLFPEAVEAFEAGDLDRTAELETRIWFDGRGRTPEQVNPKMRRLAYEMDRLALAHDAKGLGKRLANVEPLAAGRLGELQLPLLIVVGEHDEPYMHAAAVYMLEKIPTARKGLLADAAHLANMDHPEEFQRLVDDFLEGLAA